MKLKVLKSRLQIYMYNIFEMMHNLHSKLVYQKESFSQPAYNTNTVKPATSGRFAEQIFNFSNCELFISMYVLSTEIQLENSIMFRFTSFIYVMYVLYFSPDIKCLKRHKLLDKILKQT